jgi:hypothetical protein
MRVLITNNALAARAGSELYVRDLARALLARGHTPIAFSTVLGEVAEALRRATVPVVDDLDALGAPPDVIHGQHHLETMTALLRFPGVPAVYLCHGWLPWEEAPPRFPRIRRYVAVDDTCRDRLVFEHGIPEATVRVVFNFVDLARFRRRPPLPPRPARALVFSNHASEGTHVPAVREACARMGIALDVLGSAAGTATASPESRLGDYDLVFARARGALEALAVGAAVVVCDAGGAGPLVTVETFPRLRPLNFGIRALCERVTVDGLAREIARYDAADAARVTDLVRAEAGREAAVDELLALYEEVRAEQAAAGPGDAAAEAEAAAAYLRWLGPFVKRHMVTLETAVQKLREDRDRIAAAEGRLASEHAAVRADHARLASEGATARADQARLEAELTRLRAERDRAAAALAALESSALVRLRETALRAPLLGGLLRQGLRVWKRAAARGAAIPR